ncbi:hypothetical protein CPter91_1082 [Collimonas pratensis]|uniref:Uncharacterized protein n=1 Tax=Collimonas pratensis TaxID=279113 RepID=A0A127Q0B3_9BURK|nr:hypothetical protein CPter91_1082 [Collimonas pratensis]
MKPLAKPFVPQIDWVVRKFADPNITSVHFGFMTAWVF